MKETIVSLQEPSNYFKEFICDSDILIKGYIEIIKYYQQTLNEKKNKQKKDFPKNFEKKGISLLNQLYRLLLIYTRNPILSIYQSQKASLYYNEFINQITSENSLLPSLSPIDASLFIYKKVLYDVTIKNKTLNLQEKHLMEDLDLFISNIDNIISKINFYYPNKFFTILESIIVFMDKYVDQINNNKLELILKLIIIIEDNTKLENLFILIEQIIKNNKKIKNEIEPLNLNHLSSNKLIRKILN